MVFFRQKQTAVAREGVRLKHCGAPLIGVVNAIQCLVSGVRRVSCEKRWWCSQGAAIREEGV